MKNYGSSIGSRQSGSVLLVSIIFLLVLGLLGLASMSTSRIELRLANNTESQTSADQAVQALADVVVAIPAMTPIVGAAGYTLCTPGVSPCNNESIYMPAGDLTAEVDAGHLWGSAVMTAPGNSPPPRGLGFSADKFTSTAFEVNAQFDRTAAGLGTANITQGILIVTPIS